MHENRVRVPGDLSASRVPYIRSLAYVAKGQCAFDHDGWTPASELIAVSRAAEPAADYEAQPIDLDLDDFCRRHNHRARQYFAFDPWDRAVRFIRQFPAPDSLLPPPTESQAADS